MTTRLLIGVALLGLLAAPAGALASHGGKAKNMSSDTVTYELRGTLSAFTAAKGMTAGSIAVHVTGANERGRAFKGQTLTFAITKATKVETNDNGTIANGDRGEVKVKGARGLDAAALQKLVPRKVEDEARDEDDDGGDDHGGDGDRGGHDDHGGHGRH